MENTRQRYGMVIGLRAEKKEEYLALHRSVWPEVDAMIGECNIRNFIIFMKQLPDGEDYLFMYFDYIGDDYEADMAKMAAHPKTQEWWAVCKPCQKQLPNTPEGEWWAPMEPVVEHW